MSEYGEKIQCLKSSVPKWLYYYDDTTILDKIRRNPIVHIFYSMKLKRLTQKYLILFPQMLDDGHLTSLQGVKVSFKDAIILMTSECWYTPGERIGTGVDIVISTKDADNSKLIRTYL
jgi:ATP-dependent Clp protease ATP-binding subunit ClpC